MNHIVLSYIYRSRICSVAGLAAELSCTSSPWAPSYPAQHVLHVYREPPGVCSQVVVQIPVPSFVLFNCPWGPLKIFGPGRNIRVGFWTRLQLLPKWLASWIHLLFLSNQDSCLCLGFSCDWQPNLGFLVTNCCGIDEYNHPERILEMFDGAT